VFPLKVTHQGYVGGVVVRMMMMRKERIPSWSLRKIKISFELAGEILDEDGGDNMGTALCKILNKRRESILIGLYLISVKLFGRRYCNVL
jgi:hypothetical protein